MRKMKTNAESVALDAVAQDARISRFIEAEAGDARSRCWLRVDYAARDPLMTRIAMCAPSQAEVTERFLPRTDLRDGLQRRIYYPHIVLTPDGLRGEMLFRFRERNVAVTVAVPVRAVAAFIREADELVPFGAGELDALNASLATMSDERFATP